MSHLKAYRGSSMESSLWVEGESTHLTLGELRTTGSYMSLVRSQPMLMAVIISEGCAESYIW